MPLKWYGDQAQGILKADVNRRVFAAGVYLFRYIRSKLGDPVVKEKTRVVERSQPGDYPRKEIGHLRRNVTREHDFVKVETRVGTNVPYGRYLELGTRKMERRPWLSRAVAECVSKIKTIMEQGRTI
jgi:hypothetical protein